ncbi:MAG: hypothetical protein H3C26_16565 [Rhodocyclaceae bacterium]|nr:hypothetical protein [Rhodocyclaceae bacterium]
MRTSFAASTVLASGLLVSVPTLAHNPNQSNIRVAHCWAEDTEVVCRSTRALSGAWNHVPVQVFAAADNLLHATKTDGQGRVRFERPPGAFHVLIGDKPGEAVEVDWRDVDAETTRRRETR